jgi:hypothetical protein
MPALCEDTRESSPDNEGTKNDLYLIQGPDPRRIEKMFGMIDGRPAYRFL